MEVEVDDRTLYIGNIDKDVTEEILYELFLQAGPIERVSIPCNRNDSFRYGFVTYKHEVSIDYAIELFKGTTLFKKELLIKRKGAKGNNNGQQLNDFNKYGNSETSQPRPDFQESLASLQQFLLQKPLYNPAPLINFTSNSIKGNWTSRNKPYNLGNRNHGVRARETRDRRKDRDYGNKLYHGRKNRHRD